MRPKQPPKDYGYRVDISNPKMGELYERFKKYKGIPRNVPCSESERIEFETCIFAAIAKKQKKKETKNG